MSEAQECYLVRTPVLWFREIGRTASDAPFGFPEQSYAVFASALAMKGDRFHFVECQLVHESAGGSLSRAAMRLQGNSDIRTDLYEAMKLAAAGDLAIVLALPPVVPPRPAREYPSVHTGVERLEVSPAFAEMMDATEGFRHDCDDQGYLSVICSDYGPSRAVTLCVVDPETGHPSLFVEHDPLSSAATLTVVDEALRTDVAAALGDIGISLEGDGVFTLADFRDGGWDTLVAGLTSVLLHAPEMSRPMAMTA